MVYNHTLKHMHGHVVRIPITTYTQHLTELIVVNTNAHDRYTLKYIIQDASQTSP